MNKKGFEMSFSLIFSIVLIAIFIFVAFYAIGKFIGLRNCTQTGLFFDDFKNKINEARASDIIKISYSGVLPRGIESVCIGNLSVSSNVDEYDSLKKLALLGNGANVFLYPSEKACNGFEYQHIDYLDFDYSGIKCFKNIGGKVSIPLEKNSTDSLVRVQRS